MADGAELKALAVGGTDGYVVNVRPELVVEIAFNELQVSRRYPGGLALRFARVVRYRPDKTAADADTIETVRALARVSPPDSVDGETRFLPDTELIEHICEANTRRSSCRPPNAKVFSPPAACSRNTAPDEHLAHSHRRGRIGRSVRDSGSRAVALAPHAERSAQS